MLDASQRLNILYLLRELQLKRDLSILMITHDLSVSKVVGGRTAVLYLGNLVEIGPTVHVLSHPTHPYTELLISAAPKANFAEMNSDYDEFLNNNSATIESSTKLIGGCMFRNRCKYSAEVCTISEPKLASANRS